MEFSILTERLKQQPPKRIAVAAAEDEAVLKAVSEAYSLGIAVPVLCGDIEKIDAIARRNNIDISAFEIIETDSNLQSAAIAVSLVKTGRADMLMKGLLQTADLLRAVLDKEKGLRTGNVLSHVTACHDEKSRRTWYITDGAMVMYPDLKSKAQLIDNAVTAARALGVDCPKVAVIAALELVNPDMPATLDAAVLTVMNARGQIKNCIVDGPLAFDLAVSADAAKRKGVASAAAGCADILLFHSIEAANSAVKAMTNIGGCLFGGVVMGAAAPIVLTSRSDSHTSKLYSIAIAASIGQQRG